MTATAIIIDVLRRPTTIYYPDVFSRPDVALKQRKMAVPPQAETPGAPLSPPMVSTGTTV